MQRLENKVAIVTGGTANIGRAIATLFAEEGAKVAINGIQAEEGESLEKDLSSKGLEVAYVESDISTLEGCQRLVEETLDRWGRIDILVHNAYRGDYKPLQDQSEEGWQAMLDVSITAAFRLAQRALPSMKEHKGGSLIFISSINAYAPNARMVGYSTVKAGLRAMARQLAVELGEYGIRSNSICPGYIVTEKRQQQFDANPEIEELLIAAQPTPRLGTGLDCAQAALFLASDEASYVSGHSLVVDGARTAINPSFAASRIENAMRRKLDSREAK